jgi:hypothetical protein
VPNSEHLLSWTDNNKQFSNILKQAHYAEQRFNKNKVQSPGIIEIIRFKLGYNFLWSKGHNKWPKPLNSKSLKSDILDNTTEQSYVHNASDNVDNSFCALDNNAQYMLSKVNKKPSDLISKFSVEYDKAVVAYREVVDLNMGLSMRYYRLNLEYEAKCSALHASRYEAYNVEYFKVDVAKYASLYLEAAYNEKYASLEAVHKKQLDDLNAQLIAALERDEEWRVANGLLLEEYNTVIKDYNRLVNTNDVAVVDYNNLLDKYTSLTSLYDAAVARNKQFDAYLETHVSVGVSIEKMWQAFQEYKVCSDALTKNNTILKEKNIELIKENQVLHNENMYFKSMASSEDMVGLMYQKVANNEISDDTMIEYLFYYLFGSN